MYSRNKLSLGLLGDSKSFADKMKDFEKYQIDKKLNLNEINLVDFPDNQYYRHQTAKNQIVLHHTVSGEGVRGDINWWLQTKHRIATHVLVDSKGEIYQCYSSKYWGHHLGVKDDEYNNVELNKRSIGIEIDSWGGLIKWNGKWYPAKWDKHNKKNIANLALKPVEDYIIYPDGYRGFYAFQKYTDEQILSVEKLLLYWHNEYNIPLTYNDDMWDVSKLALLGKSGVWTHTSYRSDKSDCHPQPELKSMLIGI